MASLGNLTSAFFPVVTGHFMAEQATQQSIYSCCWFFFTICCIGFACNIILLLSEKTYKEQLQMIEEERISKLP